MRKGLARQENIGRLSTIASGSTNYASGFTYDSSGTKYHMSDHLSPRITTDTSGAVIGQQGHYRFGESWYAASTTTKFQFTSYERGAESGNDYAMARYHINRLGRFNSPDPIAGSIADPQSLNRYAYVRNDPIDLMDPLGLTVVFVCFEYALFYEDPQTGALEMIPFTEHCHWVGINLPERGGRGTLDRIKEIVNSALQQSELADCLNKFFGPGTILTNQNLPYVNATKSSEELRALGRPKELVPESGRSTVYVASDVVNSPLLSKFKQGVYLHEVANALAIQRFTNELDPNKRAFLGPLGGPPTAEQVRQSQLPKGDRDIGREFEICVFGASASGVR